MSCQRGLSRPPPPLPAFRPPLQLLQFQQKLIHEMERYQELADSKQALAARWGEVKGQCRALCMLLGAELSRALCMLQGAVHAAGCGVEQGLAAGNWRVLQLLTRFTVTSAAGHALLQVGQAGG